MKTKKSTPERYLAVIQYIHLCTKDGFQKINIGDLAKMNEISNSISKAMQNLNIIEKGGKRMLYRWIGKRPNLEMATRIKDEVSLGIHKKNTDMLPLDFNPKTKIEISGNIPDILPGPLPESLPFSDKRQIPDDLKEVLQKMSQAAQLLSETHIVLAKKIFELYSE